MSLKSNLSPLLSFSNSSWFFFLKYLCSELCILFLAYSSCESMKGTPNFVSPIFVVMEKVLSMSLYVVSCLKLSGWRRSIGSFMRSFSLSGITFDTG